MFGLKKQCHVFRIEGENENEITKNQHKYVKYLFFHKHKPEQQIKFYFTLELVKKLINISTVFAHGTKTVCLTLDNISINNNNNARASVTSDHYLNINTLVLVMEAILSLAFLIDVSVRLSAAILYV